MRLAIADDHAVARVGLASLLTLAGHEVVVDVADGDELLTMLRTDLVDIAVLDINMPPGETGGLRAARALREAHPGIGLLFVSAADNGAVVAAALRVAASRSVGYWTKQGVSTSVAALNGILETIASGTISLEPRLVAAVTSPQTSPIEALTVAEREKLALLASAMTSSAIADALRITPRAVDDSLTKVYAKLGLSNDKNVNPRIAAVLMFQDYVRRGVA